MENLRNKAIRKYFILRKKLCKCRVSWNEKKKMKENENVSQKIHER